MRTLVIVDDEILVRVGFRALYDWESAGYRIAGEASSVREALPLIEELKPDIVLTDLVMNPDDGFVLIRRLKERQLPSRIVILSCRNDFQAVQAALREGADDYVFKLTMQAAEMLEVFQKVLRRPAAAEIPVRPNAPVSPPAYPATTGFLGGTGGELEAVRSELGPSSAWVWGPNRYRIMVLQGRSEPVFQSLPRLLGELGRREVPPFLVWNADPGVLGVLVSEGASAPNTLLAEAIEDYVLRYTGLTAALGVSASHRSAQELRSAWAEARLAVRACYHLGRTLVFADTLPPREPLVPTEVYAAIEAFRWEAAARDLPSLQSRLGTLFDLLQKAQDTSPDEAVQWVWDCLLPLREQAAALAVPLERGQFERFRSAPFLSDLKRLALSVLGETVMAVRQAEARRHRPEISRILEWVETRLQSSTTVEEAAAQVHMSPSHFAHTFKAETGTSFLQHVIGRKMDRAGKLLRGTDLLVYEVAEKVGYENANHFSSQFKQTMGLSPQEWRVCPGRNPEDDGRTVPGPGGVVG